MKKKEAKKTFTYASIPSAVNKAQQRAIKNNTTLSELIDEFVQGYAYPKRKIKGSVPLPADFLNIKSIGLLDSEGNVRKLL